MIQVPSISLISKEAARKLKLCGSKITLSITKVGNTSEVQKSTEYIIPLEDNHGTVWELLVCEMNEITAETERIDVQMLKGIFPEVDTEKLKRPHGKADILIGTDYCKLLPEKVEQTDNLQLMKGPFGYCVRGSHNDLEMKEGDVVLNVCGDVMSINVRKSLERDELRTCIEKFY